MSKAGMISKLEALLERVRSRADAPRVARAATAHGESSGVAVDAVTTNANVPVAARAVEEPTFARRGREATEADIVLDVEVQEVTSDAVIGVPADEVMPHEALGSGERLLAAEPVAADATEILVDEIAVSIAAEDGPEVSAEESDVEVTAAELGEEAPLSSRRPVGPEPEERLAEMAFGAEEPPPRHTPPPESGRLRAAPEAEVDPEETGVRGTAHRASSDYPRHEATALEPDEPGVALVAEVTRAQLPGGDAVAASAGHPPAFVPSTFVALLDASVAL